MDNTIANILIQVRLHKNLTQREVAEHLRMPLSSYSSYERGVAVPALKVLRKLADFYGISIDQLAGRSAIDLQGFKPSINLSDLKAFTMAAMQGFCSIIDPRGITESEVQDISRADDPQRTGRTLQAVLQNLLTMKKHSICSKLLFSLAWWLLVLPLMLHYCFSKVWAVMSRSKTTKKTCGFDR